MSIDKKELIRRVSHSVSKGTYTNLKKECDTSRKGTAVPLPWDSFVAIIF